MENPINILHLEDDAIDAELVQVALASADISCRITRVQSSDEFTQALQTQKYDLILADYSLPGYDGISALRFTIEQYPDMPFIFVSGTMGEDAAIQALTEGATDYVLKTKLARLVPALKRTLNEAENQRKRKQAEKALLNSEKRYRTLVNQIPAIVYTDDASGRTQFVSPQIETLLGFKPEEWLQGGFDLWSKQIHPEDRECVLSKYQELIQSKEAFECEYRIYTKDGRLIWIQDEAMVLRDEVGRVTSIPGLIYDVTERKQAEAALRESEQRYRTVANFTYDWEFWLNPEGQFIYTSPSCKQITGYDAEEFTTDPELLVKIIHPDDRPGFEEHRQKTEKESNGEVVEFRIITASGDERWIGHVCQPVHDENGKFAGTRGNNRDITAQKQAEETLRATTNLLEKIFATTEFMVAYLDADFNFIRVNRAYAEADGQEPEFYIGKNHFALFPNEENEAIFHNVLKTGKPYAAYAKSFEYVEHPERGVSYWDWSLQPVKEADGRVGGLVFTLINVTQREKAITAQHESEERFRALAESANDGIISTDINGKIFYWNHAAGILFGYADEEVLNQPLTILMPERFQASHRDGLKLWTLNGKEKLNRTLETVGRRKDGSEFRMDLSLSSWHTHEGTFFTGIIRDITERKKHEHEREAIVIVANAIRTATTRAEILTIILDQLTDLFGADGAMIATPDSTGDGIVVEMGRGSVGTKFTKLHIPKGKGVSSSIIADKTAYLNNNTRTDPHFFRPDLLGDSQAVAGVPLVAQDQTIGVLWVTRKNEISEDDVRLLKAIGDLTANAIQRVTLFEQTGRQLQRLIALHQIDISISASFDLAVTLNVFLNNVITQLGVDAANILLLKPQTQTLIYSAGIGFWTQNIKQSQVKLGEGQTGLAASQRRIIALPDSEESSEKFSRRSLLSDEKFVSHYMAPLIAKGQIKGVLEVFTRKRLDATREWLDFFETLATQAAIAIDNATLFDNLQRSNVELRLAYDATIEGWSRALDLRDRETEGHSRRVTEMTLQLADKMGMSDAEKLNLRRGALLHDIGKMGVPDSILLKPGDLTKADWEIMRRHPTFAYEMLAPIAYLKNALDIPYCHHEKWDGSGYPRGLAGEQIPLAARIFTVADVFDALTSTRPYRPPRSKAEAYEYIREQAGKHFDPKIADAFLEMEQKTQCV